MQNNFWGSLSFGDSWAHLILSYITPLCSVSLLFFLPPQPIISKASYYFITLPIPSCFLLGPPLGILCICACGNAIRHQYPCIDLYLHMYVCTYPHEEKYRYHLFTWTLKSLMTIIFNSIILLIWYMSVAHQVRAHNQSITVTCFSNLFFFFSFIMWVFETFDLTIFHEYT